MPNKPPEQLERLVGAVPDQGNALARLIRRHLVQRLDELIVGIVDAGAEITVVGHHDGADLTVQDSPRFEGFES